MSNLTPFHADIKDILEQARSKTRSAVNTAMVEAYWLIGRRIVEEEQRGESKAEYGTRLIEFAKGKFAVEIASTEQLVPTLELIKQAVEVQPIHAKAGRKPSKHTSPVILGEVLRQR
jgi:hypothetical protein